MSLMSVQTESKRGKIKRVAEILFTLGVEGWVIIVKLGPHWGVRNDSQTAHVN